MPKFNRPIISIITTFIMLPGLIPTAVIFRPFCVAFWLIWAFCIGVLFLCEYLPGRTNRKLFTKNKGVFAAIAIMGIFFAISLKTYFSFKAYPDQLVPDIRSSLAFPLVSFLPPMIVSLGVNIGNMIYKVRKRKAEKIKRQTALKRNNILRFK